jgi:hypothetical protein
VYRGAADYVLLVQERSGHVLNAAGQLAVIPTGFMSRWLITGLMPRVARRCGGRWGKSCSAVAMLKHGVAPYGGCFYASEPVLCIRAGCLSRCGGWAGGS